MAGISAQQVAVANCNIIRCTHAFKQMRTPNLGSTNAYFKAGLKIKPREFAVKRVLFISLVVLCFAIAPATLAYANTFSFSYSYDGVAASGTLEATPLGAGQFQITSITGQRNGVDIIALDDPNTFGSNDNLLSFADEPYLTFSGFSFEDANQANYNLYFDQGFYRESLDGYPSENLVSLTIESAPSAVPEPCSLALIGSGTLGILGLARRRFRI